MWRHLIVLGCLALAPAVETTWKEVPEPARTLVDQILVLNAVLEPELNAEAVRADWLALLDAARAALPESKRAQDIIPALNGVLLSGREVSYLSQQYWRDSSFVAALQRRQGNCLATTTLYVTIARALELPLYAVFVPEHAFVCWADRGQRVNIETTAAGQMTGDFTYLSAFELDGGDMAFWGWMRPQSDAELIAALRLVVARHLAGQQRLDAALAQLELAKAALPDRLDLDLLGARWRADRDRDRAPYVAFAQQLADDPEAPRAAVVAALIALGNEYAARLDRAQERAVLQRAYGLAPWHELDEILESLSTCLRGLRDHAGAVLCMELAVARDSDNLWKRAWLAGMLVEAGRVEDGLREIAAVRAENAEESYFALMEAGLLVTAGQRDEGRRRFDALEPPRTGLESWETNRAWFFAVWGDRALFYPQFERALGLATDPSVLSWIAEDDDLDPYREEARFIALVATARARLLGNEAD